MIISYFQQKAKKGEKTRVFGVRNHLKNENWENRVDEEGKVPKTSY